MSFLLLLLSIENADGWMVGWLDGWMVGWLDGWMVVIDTGTIVLVVIVLHTGTDVHDRPRHGFSS